MPGLRQKARSIALQALYEADLSGHDAPAVIRRLLAESRLDDAGRELATHLVETIVAHQAEIDRVIQRAAPLWPLPQVAVIDRNVLRLAVAELFWAPPDPAPMKVTINEAVEL